MLSRLHAAARELPMKHSSAQLLGACDSYRSTSAPSHRQAPKALARGGRSSRVRHDAACAACSVWTCLHGSIRRRHLPSAKIPPCALGERPSALTPDHSAALPHRRSQLRTPSHLGTAHDLVPPHLAGRPASPPCISAAHSGAPSHRRTCSLHRRCLEVGSRQQQAARLLHI